MKEDKKPKVQVNPADDFYCVRLNLGLVALEGGKYYGTYEQAMAAAKKEVSKPSYIGVPAYIMKPFEKVEAVMPPVTVTKL